MIEYVQFFPTLRCNQNCEFCFSRGLEYNELAENKIEEFVLLLHKNRIQNLDILGGEPFLYENLNQLVEKALEKNIKVTISTNGTLLKELEIFLKDFNNERVKVGVSINNLPKEDLLEIVKKYKLWIKSVLNPSLPPDENLLNFTKNNRINYYLIYKDVINGDEIRNSMAFYEFMAKIESLKRSFPQVEPVFCKGFIGATSNYRCPAGSEKITIMPDGSVYPCYLLAKYKEYKIGDFFESSLSEILSSRRLQIFKTYFGNICHNKICDYHEKCRGGCIAHSIIHYGRQDKPDPRCNIKGGNYDTTIKKSWRG